MTVTSENSENITVSDHPAPSRRERIMDSLSILFSSRTAMVGLLLIGFWVIIALFADDCIIKPACWSGSKDYEPTPWLARYSYLEQFSGENLQAPSAKHWLGTDRFGRDLWARLAYGARIILTLAPVSVLIALVVGATLGLVSAYYGGFVDEFIMRIMDAILTFPRMVLYLVILAALGGSEYTVILAIAFNGAPGVARLVRSLALDVMTRDYVAAAQTRGEHPLYIMYVEVLPNTLGPVIIDAMLRIGYAVFAIASLGFLGIGLPPPSPDWGSIVNAGRRAIQMGHPWTALWAALATAMLVVGLNLLADGLGEEVGRYE
jgi:peptide/nickel transport system permease protein